MNLYITDTDVEKFWSRVAIGSPDECWLWQGWRNPKGYGYVDFMRELGSKRRIKFGAHRVSAFLIHGNAPADKPHTCHICDNPPCCNYDHLFYGSKVDNMRDAAAKERLAFQCKEDSLALISGVLNYQSQLTVDDVLAIRKSGLSQKETGVLYGLSQASISRIMRGETYRSIQA